MKQRLFSRGKGWYIPCKNYKDDNDKATLFVNFKHGEEPQYQPPQGQEWCFLDVDIIEAKFGCSKGKPNMMVWSYTIIESKGDLTEIDRENRDFVQSVKGTPYANKFGGNTNIDISPDDLPFY